MARLALWIRSVLYTSVDESVHRRTFNAGVSISHGDNNTLSMRFRLHVRSRSMAYLIGPRSLSTYWAIDPWQLYGSLRPTNAPLHTAFAILIMKYAVWGIACTAKPLIDREAPARWKIQSEVLGSAR